MDGITPVGAMIKPPPQQNAIQTLSGLLGLKQQQLALQTGQAGLQTAQAQATIAGQNAKENQAGAQLMADPVGNGIVDGNGNVTKDAQSILAKAMPTTWGSHFDQFVSAATKKVAFNNAVNELNIQERTTFGNFMGGVAASNLTLPQAKEQIAGFLDTYKGTPVYDSYKEMADTTIAGMDAADQKQRMSGNGGKPITPGQEAWRTGVAIPIARTVLGAPQTVGPAGAATPQPATVGTGAATIQGTTAPAVFGGGFAPATQVPITTAPTNVSTPAGLVHVGAGGSEANVIPSAPGAAPGGLPANPSQPQAAAATALSTAVAGRVASAQAAANQTIQSQDALHRVIDVLEQGGAPATGKAFALTADVKNALSSIGIDTTGTTNSNELVKNLARYEAARATQAGLGGTDSARELAHYGSPNVNVDNRALLDITKQSLATEQAVAAYAKLQASTQDPSVLQANENKFRNIPNLVETFQYLQSRNKAEADSFLAKHGISHKEVAQSGQQLKALGLL